MQYLMYHQSEHIIYSGNNIFRLNKIPLKCFFNADSVEINQTKEYYNFLHTYCDVYNSRGLIYRRSFTSTDHIFNGIIIYWRSKKQSDTFRVISNDETRAMYTGVLYQNWIRNVFI